MATPNLPVAYTYRVTEDAAELRRADGALLGTFAPDTPTALVERTAWGWHRRDLFRAAGYDEDTLDVFEVAGLAAIAGGDDKRSPRGTV